MVEIEYGDYLRVYGLPSDWKDSLIRLVSIENEKKQQALREHIWGAAKMPDRITPTFTEGDALVIPRGFKNELFDRLKKSGTSFETTYDTVGNEVQIDFESNVTLRPQQKIAKEAFLEHKSGLIMASPGFGKTTVALDCVCEIQQKTIILVDKADLAKQWINRAKDQFNMELGLIGDGEFNEQNVTVAIMQTLRSKSEELTEDNFWYKWGCVIYDEQHHSSSETYYEIVNKFPAKYRIGISATKGKSEAKERIAEFVFGPVIFEDKTNNLKPTVHRIKTDFEFDYRPTEKIGGKVIKNNYMDLLAALIEDEDRNAQIAEKIASQPDNAHLVVSRRLNHLENLREAVIARGFDPERCLMLTGKQASATRIEIAERADSGNIVIFSTVADEGLDIPRLDRIHLVFPSKNHETIRQQVGRGLRNHPDKDETIVYDYTDMSIGVIRNQWRNRMLKYYKENDFPIECYDS